MITKKEQKKKEQKENQRRKLQIKARNKTQLTIKETREKEIWND